MKVPADSREVRASLTNQGAFLTSRATASANSITAIA
jgi:hypothetical protein